MRAVESQLEDVGVGIGFALTPWERNEYRLISWWHMEQFKGQEFQSALQVLERIRCDLVKPGPPKLDTRLPFSGRIPVLIDATACEAIEQELRFIEKTVRAMGLRTSGEVIFEIRNGTLLNWSMASEPLTSRC